MAEHFQEEVVIAGFGGQGVMLLGKLLAQAAMRTGLQVTYMPSYGAEVRGGTANSMVVMGDEPIGCPVIQKPDTVIAMNEPSMKKFAPRLKKGGLLVLNRSMIAGACGRDDIEVVELPAEEIALKAGSLKSANMVALGCYLAKRGRISVEQGVACLAEVFSERYRDTLPINAEAMRRGAGFIG